MNPTSPHNPFSTLRLALFEGAPMGKGPADSISELRQLLSDAESSHVRFSIWKRLRQLGIEPTEVEAQEVFCVIGELGLPELSVLVFGMRDGSASVYTSTGAAVIGGGGHEPVRAASRRLVTLGKDYVRQMPVVTEFPLPGTGMVRLSLLTPRGVQAIEARDDALESGQHPFSLLFVAWNELFAQIRLTDPNEHRQAARRSAAAYANCLLTLMWEKSLDPVTLVDRRLLPDLNKVATTPEDREFLKEIELPVEQIQASDVISCLLQVASFPWYLPFKKSGTLRAKLAQRGGTTVDISFRIHKSRDDVGGRRVLLSRQ